MVRSASFKGSIEVFLAYWNTFSELVKDGTLDFPIDEIYRHNKMIEEEGVKPKHHSEAYRIAYYPAYRIVLRDTIIKDLGICENSIT